MNQKLKALATVGGMPLMKIEYLAGLLGDAGAEEVLTRAKSTDDYASGMGVAYKADALDDGADDDEYPDELLSAIDDAYEQIGDWDAITTAVQQLATPVKARVLTDSGKQSVLPTTKAYSPSLDPIARAIGADQAQRGRAPVVTKSASPTLKSLIENSLNSWDGR